MQIGWFMSKKSLKDSNVSWQWWQKAGRRSQEKKSLKILATLSTLLPPWCFNILSSLKCAKVTTFTSVDHKTDPRKHVQRDKAESLFLHFEFQMKIFSHFISWTINFYDLDSKIWALKDVEFRIWEYAKIFLLFFSRRARMIIVKRQDSKTVDIMCMSGIYGHLRAENLRFVIP